MCNRGGFHDGCMASARHGLPWVLLGRKGDFENDIWELYNLDTDFSQANNLAATMPEKLEELKLIFDREAKKNQVYPLDDRFAERGVVADRPSVTSGRSVFVYFPGAIRIPEGSAPNVKAKSHSITAELQVPSGRVEGVIVAQGGKSSAGYSLFVKDGQVIYENNFFGKEVDRIQSGVPLPAGKVTVVFEYTHESTEYGGGGTGQLFVNGERVGEARFGHVPPTRYSATETFDIGMDLGDALSELYEAPFRFTGTIESVTIQMKPQPAPSVETQRKTLERSHAVAKSIE
jgi:hypothetical protein